MNIFGQNSQKIIVSRVMKTLFLVTVALFITFSQTVHAGSIKTSFEPPTMYVMNSPQAKARIKKGYFRPVFRGFGKRTPLGVAENELWGFRFLLDTDCLSTTMLSLVKQNQLKGMDKQKALLRAKIDHVEILKKEFADMASTSKLYDNYPGKDLKNEYSFLFATPILSLAKCYGPIVMVIEERRPRGLDLNGIAKDAKYYSIGRFLGNLGKARLINIAADYIMDRNEYVIPSFIPPEDVAGLIVYEPSKMVIRGKLPVIPPRVRRTYRKHFVDGAMVIDVYDGCDKLIKRFSASPTTPTTGLEGSVSTEKLPSTIIKAWNKYVGKRLKSNCNK